MLRIKKIFLIFISVISLMVVASCSLIKISFGYDVTFETFNIGESISPLNDVLNLPEELPSPEAEGYNFEGWYYDKKYQVEAQPLDLLVEDTTLYAKWVEHKFSITLILNMESLEDQVIKVKNSIESLPTVNREGYIFDGWYYDETYTAPVNIGDPVFFDICLYVKWVKDIIYTIDFVSEYGSALTQVQSKEQKIPYLPTLSEAGYNFEGWYYDQAFTKKANAQDKLTSNVVLYAKWIKPCTIIFENNGLGSKVDNITDVTKLPTTLPTLKEDGYNFLGWFYDEELTKEAKANDTITNSVKLYAKWEAKKYQINFNLNGASGNVASINAIYDEDVIIPTCEVLYKGYTFNGWNTKQDGSGASFSELSKVNNLTTEESITLYAIWTKTAYTLTVQLNNGTNDLTYSLKYQDSLPSIDVPTKPNSEFEGWYTYVDGQEVEVDLSTLTMPDSNLLIFAKYKGEVSVVFVVDGETYKTLTGIQGQSIDSTIPTPTITGYTFGGWHMDIEFQTPYNLTDYPNTNITVYGKVTPNNVTINFNSNGGSGTMSAQTIVYGSGDTLKQNTFTKTGHKFNGWSLSPNKSTVDYVDGYNKDIISQGSITLYAVWERLVYTVTFVINGHGTQPSSLIDVYQLPNTLPILVEEGYLFGGWYYDQSLTNKANVNDNISKNTTLYAKWEEEKIPTPEPTEKIVDNIIYDDFQIHFLELGNGYAGDSIYIKAGENDILIDGGSRTTSVTTIKNYINQYCTDGKLEYLIVTHGDQDHIAALVGNGSNGILYQYQFGTIIDSVSSKTTDIYKSYKTARNRAVTNGAVHYTAAQCFNNTDGAQSTFSLGEGMSFTILYNYYYSKASSEENDNSVCTMFTYNDFNFMFTGDLEESGEAKLAAYYDGSTPAKTLPKVELFKAGHHGSKTSTNSALLRLIQPEIVCVTCCAGGSEYTGNYKNTFPTQAMIDRVAEYTDRVYVTTMYDINTKTYGSLNGNIIISSNGEHVGVSATNNITKLKDSVWFNTTIYANSSDLYCSGKGKTDFFTSATPGVTPRPQRVWPS